jgi:hypothetical protein
VIHFISKRGENFFNKNSLTKKFYFKFSCIKTSAKIEASGKKLEIYFKKYSLFCRKKIEKKSNGHNITAENIKNRIFSERLANSRISSFSIHKELKLLVF